MLLSLLSNSRTLSIEENPTAISKTSLPISPQPTLFQPWAILHPLSEPLELLILDISSMWDHTVSGLLWLTSFIEQNVVRVHLCHNTYGSCTPF